MLFLARYFFVAESAAQGESLWIVALWLFGLIRLADRCRGRFATHSVSFLGLA